MSFTPDLIAELEVLALFKHDSSRRHQDKQHRIPRPDRGGATPA